MNKKLLFFFIFSLALIATYIFFEFYALKDTKGLFENIDISQPLSCDLNKQDCAFDFQGKKVIVSFSPKPLQSLEVTHFSIKNFGDYEDLELQIYGLNMFMGTIKPKLNKINKTDYEGKMALAACTLDSMRFRAELKQQQQILFSFDFELRK
ncbi:hypothetical protein OQH60_02935 [Campylobacter sp. MIT 21-1685]|uniref:hypothetical protein n=1 Tax=unclassified Campylobacter TaxID=2593542 RepID=UPI00224B9FF6|nr:MULTISPECIES: hypothetical protein [unclassified Campylobacter]MCX2682820.1 hypothetical protein [Campylobacter sp. MIT 21-1684]MCX2751034.1 hypothetical protein [Campylobacter sp. MIT 21-1682]MCX2807301.1 hypothetical protein [Campylobacter sp. MIT 21-1685]